MNSKLLTIKILSLLTVSVLLASCGTKTNPTEGYDLPVVPATGQQENKAQGVQAGDLFYIELPKKGMSFVEGKPGSFEVKIHTVLSNVQFRLVAPGLPDGLSMAPKNPNEPMGTYVISGTVPVGTSPSVKQGTDVDVTISVDAAKGDAKELELLKASETSITQNIKISPTDQVPVVEPRAALSVNEGDSVTISIIVKDIGSHNSEMPTLLVVPSDDSLNGEVQVISAAPGLKLAKTGIAKGDNRFEFKMTLDSKRLEIPAGKKDLTARFSVEFQSPSQTLSAAENVDVKIVRKAPPAPVVAPAPVAAPAPAQVAAPAPAVAAKPAPVASNAVLLIDSADTLDFNEGQLSISKVLGRSLLSVGGQPSVSGKDFVVTIDNLSLLPGATYDSSTGVLSWTPAIGFVSGSATRVLKLKVTLTTKAPPVLKTTREIAVLVSKAASSTNLESAVADNTMAPAVAAPASATTAPAAAKPAPAETVVKPASSAKKPAAKAKAPAKKVKAKSTSSSGTKPAKKATT